MPTPLPEKLQRVDDDRLRITWTDGAVREYRVAELRERCPCATCREKRSAPEPPTSQLTVLSAAETQPLRLVGMRPVGAYAYHLDFSDGHNTGLYTLDFLRELGEGVGPAAGVEG